MIEWYQHFPERIDPVVFMVGFFSLYWYAVMYLVAIGVGGYALWRQVRGWMTSDQYVDLLFNLVVGILVGSRVGYVLLYNFSFYAAHPLAIVWPFDNGTGVWVGISGMSYYGGLVGVMIGVWLFARQYRCSLWKVADAIGMAVPLGYFFGRIGNFLNGELYGRVTERVWGMYFPEAPMGSLLLRHPSQLYEAFFEGIVLALVVIFVQKRFRFDGAVGIVYVMGYSFFRFGIEFFREPDPQIGLLFGVLTLGQVVSLIAFFGGVFFFVRRKKYAILNA